ncbi:MAG: histidine kinase [Balneolales bacterium]|nr:histidine kinase [Balneolales bacterium]
MVAQVSQNIIHITTDDGLSQNLVFDLEQDQQGFIWIGTKDGLSRYDGYNFKIFRNNPSDSTTLSSNYITFIQEDEKQNLWVETSPGGLHLYDSHNDKFIRLKKVLQDVDSFHSSSIQKVIWNDENGWLIFTNTGLFELSADLKNLNEIPLNEGSEIRILSVFVPPDYNKSKIYLSTLHSGIYEYNTAESVLRPLTTINEKLDEQGISHVFKSNNNEWMLAGHNTLYTFSEHGELLRKYRMPTNFNNASFPIISFQQDKFGRFWVIRDFRLYEYLPIENRVVELAMHGGINQLFIDRTGIFWIGTSGYGMYKFNPNTTRFGFTSERFFDVVAPGFHQLMEAENYFGFPRIFGDILYVDYVSPTERWVLTRRLGLFNLNLDEQRIQRHIITVPPQDQNTYSSFWMDRDVEGHYNVLLSEGLVHFEPEAGTTYHLPLLQIFPDFTFDRNLPVFEQLTVVRKINTTYWFGSTEHGLASYNTETQQQRSFAYGSSDVNTISSNHILSISQDMRNPEKYIWVGTDGGGLNRINLQTGSVLRFTEQDGLPNNVIYSIYPDSSGHLWMSSNKGIIRMDPDTFEILNFTRSDGLQSDEFNRRQHYQFEDGRLLMCGSFGCNLFNPNDITLNPALPTVSLTDISVMNRSVLPYGSEWFSENEDGSMTLRVDWDQNIIGFEFAALEFSGTDKNQYKYRFPPFLQEWTNIGTRREISFTNLDPGSYTLEVMGSNNDGVWSEIPARIGVLVLPPFWMTFWFRALSIMLAFSTIAFVVWFISERKHRKQVRMLEYKMAVDQERLRISRDMHDDLGSRLTQIRLMSEFAKQDKTIPEKIRSKFDEISVETKDIIQNFNEIVWSLNPQNDTLNNLTDFMIQYSERFCQKVQIPCRIYASDEFPEVKIASSVRTNLIFILKEALNNAAKYSFCEEIQVHLRLDETRFYLIIVDDGIGFDELDRRTFGQGLETMKNRAETILAKFELTSELQRGTEIRVIWNIQPNPKG